MSNNKFYIVALDQGTTSSRAILYDEAGKEIKIASRPLPNHFPKSGWVEQDPEAIWRTQAEAFKEAIAGVAPAKIKAIGLTNQRETTIAWERKTGKPLAPAIVWQCRRSADICADIRKQGLEQAIRQETGLMVDAYFSASKIRWLLENISGLPERVKRHEVVFGTVDSWLLEKLSREAGNAVFRTEPSNASRTMLMSLARAEWSETMLDIFGISADNLAEIVPSNSVFAEASIQGRKIPITAVLGDQQAALFGHGCLTAEATKCTFGTGAFLLTNTGDNIRASEAGMLQTVAWQTKHADGHKEIIYALEGSVFVAGALIQWVRDKLKLIQSAAESETAAMDVKDSNGVVIVPAFVGLGAPHWLSEVRGAIFGLTRDSGRAEIVRASLEAVAQQVADLLEAAEFREVKKLQIDGGMCANRLFCEILADLSGRTIEVSSTAEVTALGAAKMAVSGLADAALQKNFSSGAKKNQQSYHSRITSEELVLARQKWKRAVRAVKSFSDPM